MCLSQRKSKGQLVVNTIIAGLFAIGAMIFIYYVFLIKVAEVRSLVNEYETERHAMNLANALISNKAIAYESSGVIYRGILDKRKLDNIFQKSQDSFKSKKEMLEILASPIDENKIGGLSYPDTFNFVVIIDLDSCDDNENCSAWGGVLASPISLENTKIPRFFKCLKDTFDNSGGAWIRRGSKTASGCAAGALIGSVVPGVGTAIGAAIGCGVGFVSTLWSTEDIQQCFQKVGMSTYYMEWFSTSTPISHQGLPVLIRYPDGSLHTGRIIVSLLEWY